MSKPKRTPLLFQSFFFLSSQSNVTIELVIFAKIVFLTVSFLKPVTQSVQYVRVNLLGRVDPRGTLACKKNGGARRTSQGLKKRLSYLIWCVSLERSTSGAFVVLFRVLSRKIVTGDTWNVPS